MEAASESRLLFLKRVVNPVSCIRESRLALRDSRRTILIHSCPSDARVSECESFGAQTGRDFDTIGERQCRALQLRRRSRPTTMEFAMDFRGFVRDLV